MRSAVVLLALGCSSGCTFTLPFDDLSGGAPRPTSLYHFDDGSGISAADAYGRNQANLQQDEIAPIWTKDGKRGGAISFKEDGWINIPTLSGNKAPARGTLALWVNLTKFPVDDEWELFGLEQDNDPSNENDDNVALGLYVTENEVNAEAQEGLTAHTDAATKGIPLNTWAFLVIGWDVAANEFLLYVRPDGKTPYPVQHGHFPAGFKYASPFFTMTAPDGRLDEVSYFDHMLPQNVLDLLD